MSNVPITDAASATRKVDTFQRTDGADTVETQAVAVINPATGDPLRPDADGAMPVTVQALPLPTGAATQATLAALNVIAAAVQAAVEAINGKTTEVNTSAIAGTVALDAPTLAALESITASTGGLTNAELRATAVPVAQQGEIALDAPTLAALETVSVANFPETQPISAASLPLPSGAATETTVAALAAAVGAHDAVASNGRSGLVMLVRRRDSDAEPIVDDGDLTFLNIDEEGRLKVASKPASYPDVTGSITAVQATIGTPVAGGTVEGDVSRASNVMAFCSGTFSTVNCTFEGSLEPTGDTNWFGVQAIRSNANTIETTTGNLSAQPAYAWELSVNALARLRVRCTARTSGTQNWRFKLGTYATEPIPGAQVSATQPVSGTVTANQGTLATPTANILNSAASTNGTVVKASAGTLYSITASNNNAAVRYLKLHNSTTVTPGTTAVALIIPLPPGVVTSLNLGALGMRFGTGICLSITTGAADNDTGAVAAGEIKVMTSFV